MTNTKLLEEAIDRSGLKKGKIAERLGISRAGLINLINNRSEFRVSQIQTLCEILNIELDHHNAGSDARACAQLFLRCMDWGADPEKFTRSYDVYAHKTVKDPKPKPVYKKRRRKTV
mgnify:CR=1 FL=1